MGRRGENIHKRKDGRWEARIVQGEPTNGRTNYKYFYGGSYQEVKEKKKAFLAARETPAAPAEEVKTDEIPALYASQLNLGDIALSWLEEKQGNVKESTYACYVNMVTRHILPEIGTLPLAEINSGVLRDFLNGKKQHGRVSGGALSDKTISDLKSLLSQILRYAEAAGLTENAPKCPPTPCRQPSISVLSKWEQAAIEKEAAAEDRPFSLGILLSLYAGLRIGEVCALQWKDFDTNNETVSIRRTVIRIQNVDDPSGEKTKVIIGAPKTACSLRTIPLPDFIFSYFMERRLADERFMMTGSYKFMEPRVCLDRYKRLLRRAGVPDHTFHALRHTFATRCVENGMDLKSLSEIMGHSSVKITLQRYVHPSMDSKKEQMTRLAKSSCQWAK